MEHKVEKLTLTVKEPTSQMAQVSHRESKTAKFVNFAMEQTIKVMLVAASYISAYMIVHFNLHPTSLITLITSALFMVFIGFIIYKRKPKGKRPDRVGAYADNNADIINPATIRRLTGATIKVVCCNVLLFGMTYGLTLLIAWVTGLIARF